MRLEGGFSGRTNKLVDCCYSFWLGAMFPLIDKARKQDPRRQPNLHEDVVDDDDNDAEDDEDGPLIFDQRALQALSNFYSFLLLDLSLSLCVLH